LPDTRYVPEVSPVFGDGKPACRLTCCVCLAEVQYPKPKGTEVCRCGARYIADSDQVPIAIHGARKAVGE